VILHFTSHSHQRTLALTFKKVRGKKKMFGDGTQANDVPYAVPFNEYVLQNCKFIINQ